MQQECIVSLAFRGKPKSVTRVTFLVCGIPRLGIGRIGDNSIYIERVIGVNRVVIIEIRPIFLQRVAVARHDIVRQNAPHYQIHAGQVVGVFLKLLSVVFDVVSPAHVTRHALADIDKQGA